MADRYWVGGTGNWSDTARWSTSDGGGSGASVPGQADDVFFTANSNVTTGAFTVTVNTGAVRICKNFTASGLDGTMTFAGTETLDIHGNISLPATNFTWTYSGLLRLYTASEGATNTINFNGKTSTASQINFSLGGGYSAGTFQLQAALTAGSGTSIQLNSGTLDIAGYTVTTPQFILAGSGTKALTFGSGGSVVLNGTGTVWQTTGSSNNSITDSANATITLTNTTTTARTFQGAGLSYGKLTIGGTTGTSTLTITGSNTFTEIASTKTVAHTITFTDGTTQTVGAWTVKGTRENVVTLQGSSTAGWNLAYAGQLRVTGLDYLSVSRSTATPADTWYAGEHSTNGGNNSGWQFVQDPDDFLIFFPGNVEYGSG